MKLLLAVGANVNDITDAGISLHYAASNGNSEIVKLLLVAGADIHSVD